MGLPAVEEFSDTKGEEGTNPEVDQLFFTLVLQDESVTGLHQWACFGVIDGLGEIDFDGDLSVARSFPEDEQTGDTCVYDTLIPPPQTPSTATATALCRDRYLRGYLLQEPLPAMRPDRNHVAKDARLVAAGHRCRALRLLWIRCRQYHRPEGLPLTR